MKQLALILTLFVPLGFLNAQDWAAHKITVKSEKKIDERTILELEDEKQQAFRLTFVGALDGKTIQKVLTLKKTLYDMKSVKIKQLSVLFAGGTLEVLLRPEKMTCGEKDMTPHVPGGLLMTQSDRLEYNFRVVVDNNFIRIKGVYSKEEELCSKMAAAVKNPRDYARRRDPEYFLKTLVKQEKQIMSLQAANKRILQNNKRLMYAIITLHNSGLFSGPTPPDQRALERLVALKRANPKLTREAAASKLSNEKLTLSGKVIGLIFAVYFGEFK